MNNAVSSTWTLRLILVGILLWASFLRLWRCDQSLPGLQTDEAANAWNAKCLLKTGMDEWGQRWPIFYTRALDDYRSPLYLYLLMPIQALGGMTVCTTRLPAAICGIITIGIVYLIGRRMFDAPTGLLAAALMTLSPWHIQHTRWGHEGTITPLLAGLSFLSILWACSSPRIWKAIVAGVVTGIACYGYAAMRIFIPITLLGVLIVTLPSWLRFLRTRGGAKFSIAMAASVLLTVGPLVCKHLTDPNMNRRARETRIWNDNDSIPSIAGQLLQRYAEHYGPNFLFLTGQTNDVLSPPHNEGEYSYGWLHLYLLPMLLVGITIAAVTAWRGSLPARILLILLLTYPAADVTFGEAGKLHPLRCFPGLIALALLASVGTIEIIRWLATRSRAVAIATATALAVVVVFSHIRFARIFFGPFNDEFAMQWLRHVDLMDACRWLKPRLDSGEIDDVFCTKELLLIPHYPALVYLDYDPEQWFEGVREYSFGPDVWKNTQVCTRVGKLRFMYFPQKSMQELTSLSKDGKRHHIVMILRPDQRAMAAGHEPVHVVKTGAFVGLLVYEFDL